METNLLFSFHSTLSAIDYDDLIGIKSKTGHVHILIGGKRKLLCSFLAQKSTWFAF